MSQRRSQPTSQGFQQENQDYQQRPNHKNADLLLSDEEVLIDARPAWSAWTGTLLIAALIFIVSLATGDSAAIAVGLIVTITIVAYVWYQRQKVRYLITDSRVLVVTGITSRNTNEAWLEDVKGMQTGASFLERVLGHGHIMVSREILPRGSFLLSQIRGNGMKLGGIHNHEEIAHIIRQRQSERKR